MKIIKKNPLLFILGLMIILGICFFLAINIGSIKVSFIQLMKGLFIEYNKDVASIYQIRFPRVIVTMLVGCALALSGLLFQVVLKIRSGFCFNISSTLTLTKSSPFPSP